ncbi:MAG: sigma-54 dependent transcriptional regulator [Pseudomonadota bacterium]
MDPKGKILIVEDDEVARKNLSRLLSRDGHKTTAASTGKEAIALLGKDSFDLVITDLVLGEMSGIDLLTEVKRQSEDIEVIVITGYASVATAIEATKKGAYHYLQKPLRADEVRHLIGKAIEKKKLKDQMKVLEEKVRDQAEPELIGQSQSVAELAKLIRQVALSDTNVLITGESGTGKELVAKLIHHHSRRFKKTFVAFNCGGFTEELLANELFGHEKDAFTGATSTKTGLLESANGGTLFFDEVGDMPISMQVKLLRVIQERELIRVGGNKPIPIDVRIIGATNQDIKKTVAAGTFRHDLYYRLNVITINLPPLRERKEDIPLLAYYFLRRAMKKSDRNIKGFSDEALKILRSYDFPGNVRELENIVERAVALASGDTIEVRDLPPDLGEMEIYSYPYKNQEFKTLEALEREYIQWVLRKVDRNKTQAAKILGIDRASLWRKVKKYEVED